MIPVAKFARILLQTTRSIRSTGGLSPNPFLAPRGIKNKEAKLNEQTVHIDKDDQFVIDHDNFIKWFASLASTIFDQELEHHEIPYFIFCAGAEAALRCNQIEKVH